MKLDFETLRPAILGAVDAQENGAWIRLRRFTAKQCKVYETVYKEFFEKTDATAGIRLDFETDAKELSFRYQIRKGSSRTWYVFDGYINGTLVHHVHDDMNQAPEGRFTMALPGEPCRVTVYLPCLAGAALSDVELNGATLFRPSRPKLRLLSLGDSITQGYDAEYPSFSYPNLLAARTDAEVVNQGIGGELFNPDALDPALPYAPDLITVAYGTNDWSRGQDNFHSKTEAYMEKLHRQFPHTPTAVILPIWRGDNDRVTGAGTFEQARQFIKKTAEQYENFRVIDGMSLVPHLPGFFVADYLHPNDLGFQRYAANLLLQLEKIFLRLF